MAARKSAKTARSSSKPRQRTLNEKAGTEPPKKSVADHSEHPENPGDSTVRHTAPGFPQGEGDVTPPAKSGPATQKDETQALVDQHLGPQDVDAIQEAIDHPNANRLETDIRAIALEGVPAGFSLEKEAPNRWRARANLGGGIRWGHGATAQEAIESYILGTAVRPADEASAEAFHALPADHKADIEERDRLAAERVGQDPNSTPEAVARREFVKNERAASKAKKPAANATTDGPERVSAIEEEAQAKRQGARKRTGSPARKGSKSGSKKASGKK